MVADDRLQANESGENCAVGMRMKYGELWGWRARTYVAEAQQQHADFFVREMANECGEENLFPDEAHSPLSSSHSGRGWVLTRRTLQSTEGSSVFDRRKSKTDSTYVVLRMLC